jgi:hypothetical protein
VPLQHQGFIVYCLAFYQSAILPSGIAVRIGFSRAPLLVAFFAQPLLNRLQGTFAGPMPMGTRLALTFFFIRHHSNSMHSLNPTPSSKYIGFALEACQTGRHEAAYIQTAINSTLLPKAW